jgi:type IV secretory pathway VirB3-like protein
MNCVNNCVLCVITTIILFITEKKISENYLKIIIFLHFINRIKPDYKNFKILW